MDQQSQETSEVLTFAPRQRMCNESDPIDQAGQAASGDHDDGDSEVADQGQGVVTLGHTLGGSRARPATAS